MDFMLLSPAIMAVILGAFFFFDLKKKNLITSKLKYSFLKILVIGLLSSNISVPMFGMIFGLWPVIVATMIVVYVFAKELS